MFSRVRVDKTSLEVRGRRLKPRNMRISISMPDNPRVYVPFIVVFTTYLVISIVANSAILLNVMYGVFILATIFGIFSLISALSPVFRADQTKEMLTWFDFSGQPRLQLYFRDIEKINLGVWRESVSINAAYGDSLVGRKMNLWYVSLLDKMPTEHDVLVTANENEARKTAEYLGQLIHRPLVDITSDITVDSTETNLPLWQKMENRGDVPDYPELKEEDGIIVDKSDNRVMVKIKPFEDFPMGETKKLLGYIILCVVTGVSLFVSILLAMGEVIPAIVVVILVGLLAFLIYYTNNYYLMGRNHEEVFALDRSNFTFNIKRGTKTVEITYLVDDLRDLKVDDLDELHMSIVTKDQIYYVAYSLSPGGIQRLEQTLKAALVQMKIKTEQEKREMEF